jgi:hypothetical protein
MCGLFDLLLGMFYHPSHFLSILSHFLKPVIATARRIRGRLSLSLRFRYKKETDELKSCVNVARSQRDALEMVGG